MMKALIAMSGGVDSSVTALLMKEKGFDCIGANMRLFDNEDAGINKEKTCCSADDAYDASSVAARLSMPFYVLNLKDAFKKYVIDDFVYEYENGRTPNPCIRCNEKLKFGALLARAYELGCDCLATGHYVRIERSGSRFLLKKAADRSKDQSYVLYGLNQEQLAHALFPLGELTKDEVRELARAHGFINSGKKDSQDICFVPDGDYLAAIKRFSKKSYPPGDFIGPDGSVLGTHKGIPAYTIGQRRGLGLSLPESLYVRHLDIENNKVFLSRNDDLFSGSLDADNVNWIAYDKTSLPEKLSVTAKIRYSAKEESAVVYPIGADKIHIEFDRPVRAVTPGQAVVMYDGDTVVGGGTIK